MNRGLWLLLWLQLGGWLRFLGQNLRTLRGAILAAVGLLVFLPWFVLAIFSAGGTSTGIDNDQVRRFTPLVLLAYCLSNVLFNPHNRGLYFSPPETLFLFSGPFSRREVLAYKLLLTLFAMIPGALLLGLIFRIRDGWWLAGFLGLLLIFAFTHLFTIALTLLANTLGEQATNRGRWLVALLLVLVTGCLLWLHSGPALDWATLGNNLLDSTAWQVLSWPLQAFGDALRAGGFQELLLPGTVALLVNLALVVFIFALDAQYIESAAAASARLHARLMRMRGQSVELAESEKGSSVRWGLPMPPSLGGIGPIVWRQCTTALRSKTRLLTVFALLVVGMFLALGNINDAKSREMAPVILLCIGLWLSLFLPVLVPFDFRGDLDRMATLKTLPIASWRLALGQLITPTLLMSIAICCPLGVAMVYLPEKTEVFTIAMAFTPVVCFYLIALENLVFLIFPGRLVASTPGDFQGMGRNAILGFTKVIGLGMSGGLAAILVTVVTLLSGSLLAGLALGWIVVLLGGLAQIPLIALAFSWFDVGRDTPA